MCIKRIATTRWWTNFRETENGAGMEKFDEEGNIIDPSILKVSALKEKIVSISLKSRLAQ